MKTNIKLDDDIIELLRAKLDKRIAEGNMLLIQIENLQDRSTKVTKAINDISEVLEASCKPHNPSEYES